MCPCRMPADKQLVGISSKLSNMLYSPGDSLGSILNKYRKQHFREDPIIWNNHDNALRCERFCHKFIVCFFPGLPATSIKENDRSGVLSIHQADWLINIQFEPFMIAINDISLMLIT